MCLCRVVRRFVSCVRPIVMLVCDADGLSIERRLCGHRRCVDEPDGARCVDVICDANGVRTLNQSYTHLRRPGKLVIYGFHTMIPKTGGRPNWIKLALGYLQTPRFNPFDMTTHSRSVMAFNLSYLFERRAILDQAMGELNQWLANGQIQAPSTTCFDFEEAGRAHQAIESGQTTGKLILTI